MIWYLVCFVAGGFCGLGLGRLGHWLREACCCATDDTKLVERDGHWQEPHGDAQ